MGYLSGVCAAADTPKLLISTWVIIPVGTVGNAGNNNFIDILSIGDVETWTHYSAWDIDSGPSSPYEIAINPAVWLSIVILPSGDTWARLEVRGRISSMNHAVPTPGHPFPVQYPLTPIIVFEGDYLTQGVWNHLLMSVDLSGGPTSMVYRSGDAPLTNPTEFGPLSMYSELYINGVLSPFWNDVGYVNFVEYFATFGDAGGSGDGTTWNMAVNGSHFTVHGQRYEDGVINGSIVSPKIRLAETQVWFGVGPQLSGHVSKFITAAKKPVDPAVPRAAFGAPYALFRRNKNKNWKYETNQGAGAAFSKVGKFNDFGPGPF